jgi:translation initiation factor IF-3
LVGEDGEQLGIVPIRQALALAEEAGVDLVEIAPMAVPPVCKIMDIGKFKYQEAKKRQHEAKLKQKQVVVKEVKFRPGTDENDYQIKLRNVIKFLSEGDKAKITLRFRGREMAHQEIGMRMLERIKVDLEQQAMVEQWPKMEGRQLIMVLAPPRKSRTEQVVEFVPHAWHAETRSGCGSSSVPEAGNTWQPCNREIFDAEDEDQERCQEALHRARFRRHQARVGVQAPHPDQENHQEQAPVARRAHEVHASDVKSVRAMLPNA